MPCVDIREPGVRKLIQQLKVYKSSGPDQIIPRVLKEMAKYNRSNVLDCGEVPKT
jgi:hypothetical protein